MPTISLDELKKRAALAMGRLEACDLCPRNCRVRRTHGKEGYCKTGRFAIISSFGPHYGEERPLVGKGGSGAVFFSGCNLGCVFCQNEEISHGLHGHPVRDEELADIFLTIQRYECHNLNLVTPSHVVPQFLQALVLAMEKGFHLPVVFNTGGYDNVETLALLEGVVDIYMPDYKFTNSDVAKRFAQAPDYPTIIQAAIREMHRQVGDLEIDSSGVAKRGLLVRHLVLPSELSGTEEAMKFLAEQISPDTYINVMGQYRPCYHAYQYEKLARRPTWEEIERAQAIARKAGLKRLDKA